MGIEEVLVEKMGMNGNSWEVMGSNEGLLGISGYVIGYHVISSGILWGKKGIHKWEFNPQDYRRVDRPVFRGTNQGNQGIQC